jgi:FKBP-type peptidyl-prolyl cis-trans isomerase FkpA
MSIMQLLKFFVFVSLLAFTGCIKSENPCTVKQPQEEDGAMLAYMPLNGINGTRHSSGMYYEIANPGTGDVPNTTSRIFLRYTGRLMSNNSVFETVTDHTRTGFVLGSLIEGWKIGLPLIREGGRIKLVIPSALGYGCVPVGTIPANSVLVFDIELVDVQ